VKQILVLGAGQSTPYLIRHLLDASSEGFEVIVADRDAELAAARVGGHPRGRALALDASDRAALEAAVRGADVVVNVLAPAFQAPVARLCLDAGRPMVSASYRSPELRALEPEAKARGLTFASELGLDPGLDHMSAMRLLDAIRDAGGEVIRCLSYGSGVVERDLNPLGYAITWNPRNVVLAGAAGARFLDGGRVRVVPHPEVFRRTWSVDVPEVGRMEAYANRDAIGYIDTYGVEGARTMIRATLRHVGYCETWYVAARLGLANETVTIPGLPELSWRELVDVFLPAGEGDVARRLADHLGLHPNGRALDHLRWLGLFEDAPIGALAPDAETPADALVALLRRRLALPEGEHDLVILHHEIEAREGAARRVHTSTLVARGEPGGVTAMARTVGLPAALAALELLAGAFPVTGCPLPSHPDIYPRLLPKVEAAGLRFEERARPAG
jgi:saccharopine dehydrogenase-like NADP-dependent oxidoreductase